MKATAPILIISALFVVSCSSPRKEMTTMRYSVPEKPWSTVIGADSGNSINDVQFVTSRHLSLGNHRALIRVPSSGDAAHVSVEWRRHDRGVDSVRFYIVNAETGSPVQNIYRVEVNNERCDIVFGPVTAGSYYFYYLPFMAQTGWGWYDGGHLVREDPPYKAWMDSNKIKEGQFSRFVQAECTELQARTEFDSFCPMEVIATEKEKKGLIASHSNDKFLLFPEDRKYPIRMLDNIPQKWILDPTQDRFKGTADRNEYYAFQLGLFAVDSLEDVKVNFNPLTGQTRTLPVEALTCFNTGGVDPYGKPFVKTVNVPKGRVQPLWIGVDIPRDIEPGIYKTDVEVTTHNAGEKKVSAEIEVTDKVLEDRGDSQLWRHSRLRWLNSTAGIDDLPVAPYGAIQVHDSNSVSLTGKDVSYDKSGLPSSVKVHGNEILAAPVRFQVETSVGNLKFVTRSSVITKQQPGIITRRTVQRNDLLTITTDAETESDGWLRYTFSLDARFSISVADMRLEIPIKTGNSTYVMGMGLPGSNTPANHDAKWEGPHDSFWLGSTRAGLYCELRGASYSGPMLNLYHPAPPPSWYNGGKGGFRIRTAGDQRNVIVYSGHRQLKKGERLQFECAFVVTPVKELNTHSQFTDRFFHNPLAPDPGEAALATGAKIINLHHANKYNPHINYPFVAVKEMKDFVDRWHSKGMKVKIYYTIRELTNYVGEIWALRSLGNEVLAGGAGGGYTWLREHFVDNYSPSWYQYLDSSRIDASTVTAPGASRWLNYYVEGLGWLVKNQGIDGLYLDDVTYDRNMMKRMRKVMEAVKPGCLIDLHSNTLFSIGPAIQYTEFFPYIDKVWFGEGFFYNRMTPANWLIESSGIPFGLMGDMLPQAHNEGDNPYRGMIFGMTSRLGWILDYSGEGSHTDPSAIWKVLDDFKIADSRMIGFWDDRPVVTTSDKDVLATAYLKEGKMLISIASWAKEKRKVKLLVNFPAIGIMANKAKITAPPISGFQLAKEFRVTDPVPVDPAKGWLLLVEEK
jgi:hypothetical protein